MSRYKATFDFRFEHFPILIKYNGKEYEIKGTSAGKLLMTKKEDGDGIPLGHNPESKSKSN